MKNSASLHRTQALKPLLAVLAADDAGEARSAARLLGTVLAKRPAIADFLVGEGALPTVAYLVANGAWRQQSCTPLCRQLACTRRVDAEARNTRRCNSFGAWKTSVCQPVCCVSLSPHWLL